MQPEEAERARQLLQEAFPTGNCPKVVTEQRLLGGHLGDMTGKRRYVCEKVEKWVSLINKLANVAEHNPQAAYTALVRSVQCEWQYVQRTVNGCGPWFAPVEQALTERFLPSLLKIPKVTTEQRQLYALPVKFGGLGLPDPTSTADATFATSRAATEHLGEAIRGRHKLCLPDHQSTLRKAREAYKSTKTKEHEAELAGVLAKLPEEQKQAVERAVKHKTGAWLTAMPTARNGNQLSADEWRDGIAFRYGLEPTGLQPRCDGCGERFDADHALKCRKGGLIIKRHNDVCLELQQLAEMNWPDTVLAPVIRPGNSSLPSDHPERDGLVGDLMVRGGVHTSQTDVILDVQVIYLNTSSRARRNQTRQRGRPRGTNRQATTDNSEQQRVETAEQRGGEDIVEVEGVEQGGGADIDADGNEQQTARVSDRAVAALRTQERVKELKHKTACEATRRDFIPFIVSTDGCIGEQAQAFLRRLSMRLANKWQRPYSQVYGFVRARMSISILRASSQCLRGPRVRVQGAVCIMEDGAALGVAQL